MFIFPPKKFEYQKRSRFNWKKIGKAFLCLIAAGFLAAAGTVLWFRKDLPDPGHLSSRSVIESTKIYDRSGTHLLYDIHGEEKRTQIDFSQMPESLKYATISLEDQDFYNHHGIKIKGMVRAALKDIIQLGAAEGGSTITQQLVKRAILTSEKTLTRKIKEIILALELEIKLEKNDILGMYLNEIPYGSNAYGAEAAAQTFFNRHTWELTLDEAALLASLPQAPSFFSPYGSHTDRLKIRQEYALTQMARLGYITEEQAEEAKKIDVLGKIKPSRENISAPHFVMYIKEYLEKKYGEQEVEQGGLKVFTTLDWEKQKIAEEAVKNNAAKNSESYNTHNAALVAMDPKTGQILSMVGSKDYFGTSWPEKCAPGKNCKFEGNFNVAMALRQPGSSFKPYVYLSAFQKGYTPETQLWDVDTDFSTNEEKDYNPKNYDGKNRGLIQMKSALAMSLNVPAVKTLYLAGVKESIANAKKMGITSLNEPDRYGLSLVLGGGEVTLLDHVNAFSTLATGGLYHAKTFILRVENSKGEIMEKFEAKTGERVIEEKYVAMLDHILSTNSLRAPVFGDKNPLRFDDRTVAAKTGTTNEWRDGWTIGYTPYLAVGVWAGNNDNTPMKQGSDGVYVAAPIWREFMDKTLPNYNKEDFPKYEKEETGKDILDGKLDATKKVEVCRIPGTKDYCLANDNCPDSERDKKTFSNAHNILYYVKKDDPRGDEPKNYKDDPQYKKWEEAVKDWLDEEEDSDSPPDEECEEDDFEDYEPEVEIESPSNGNTISSSSFQIKVKSKAEFGIKKVVVSVDGEKVSSGNDESLSYTYDASGKNGKEIEINAILVDDNDNEASDGIKVKISF